MNTKSTRSIAREMQVHYNFSSKEYFSEDSEEYKVWWSLFDEGCEAMDSLFFALMWEEC